MITKIKISDKQIDSVINKCRYLFYEIKEDENGDGGYKIELSFEEKQSMFCSTEQLYECIMNEDNVQFGSNNQSILCTFFISNEKLLEMRRLMTTKCTVDLNGTTFNVFQLVKMINHMKAKSQLASE